MENCNWKCILAATDFSPLGNRAVAAAHELAEKFGAELHVLHVVSNADEVAIKGGATGTMEAGDPGAWLGQLLGETGSVRRVEAVQIARDVPDKIVRYAEGHGVDLIVLASHGRSGLAHAWLGSVAERVMRSAPCPVLVLRPSVQEAARAASA
jgi:nucleotide-binding universal stress UspA family protein